MTPLFRKFLGINWVLFINMAVLIVFGIYSIYNACAYRDDPTLSNKWNQQITWALIGLPVFFGAALLDYKWLRWGSWPIYLAAIASLVLLSQIGVEIKGQKNWISLGGGVLVQPSQFAILAGIIVLAVVFGDMQRWLPIFRYPSLRLLLAGALVAVPGVLVLKEDFGSASVWGPVFCAMLLVGSIPFRYIITLILIVLCIVPIGYYFGLENYQKKRITTSWNMLTNNMEQVNLQDEGWVPNFLQIAVGSAGFEGKGPESAQVDGRSVHRTFFPNESINDFIFAVIGEEFGFRGSLLLLSVMALLLLQCVFVAFYARDQLGRLLVVGVVAMLFTHTFENAGMSIILTPITGLPMPFISYGGTFLVVTMFLMGLVQSVWVHRNISPVKTTSSGREIEED